jgi:hypothetical protein
VTAARGPYRAAMTYADDLPRTYADVDSFITMLLAACDDMRMNGTLQAILEQPDAKRRAILYDLLERFRNTGAPRDLSRAFACLLDDTVAEKAYEVIFKCPRRKLN